MAPRRGHVDRRAAMERVLTGLISQSLRHFLRPVRMEYGCASNRTMLLLHISDIHFRAPDCLNADLDPDRPYRTRLIADVRNCVAELGSVGAILIGGDVAFKGAPEEYATAMVWIHELAAVAGCPMERVFVIPGNHDVDHSVIRVTPAVRNARDAIRRAINNREREFQAPRCLEWVSRNLGAV